MKSRGKKNPLDNLPAPLRMAFEMQQTLSIGHELARKKVEEKMGVTYSKPKQKLLVLNNDGTLLYNDKKVQFKNPGTYPEKVLLGIMKTHDDRLGYAPYNKINRWIEVAGVEKLLDKNRIEKRIRNAVSNIPRSSNLKNRTLDGDPLLEVVDGKGVLLRNPDIG